MTDYGRGSGSEPWHPEDPLYGDQGWAAQQAADGQAPYGGQPQQQYPQQEQTQAPGPYEGGQDPYQQQYQQSYGGQQQYVDPRQYQDPQQYQQPQQQYVDPQRQQQHQQPQPQQPYNGGWDAGQQAAVAYGGNPADPYAGQAGGGYGEGQDYYATPDAYPPPQPPGRRGAEPGPQHQTQPQVQQLQVQQPQVQQPQAQQPQVPQAQHQQQVTPQADPGNESEWDAKAPAEETHPFFTGENDAGDEHDDDPENGGRGDGRDRRGNKTKKKGGNGKACLILAVVLVGGVGGVGYFGYTFYQDQFGPAPDFAGAGTGSVEVEVPTGAGGAEIAELLFKNGVVKSPGAFIDAQKKFSGGKFVQAGVYTLRKGMSGETAIKLMLDPDSQSSLIIPPGTRNIVVYKDLDKKLGLPDGTTEGVAKNQAGALGLPEWAKGHKDLKDPLEGFLYPASYPVAKGMKPEAVLKKMVARANAEYVKLDLETNAKKFDVDGPWQLITVASLVQAEGKTHDDFRKMAEVIYNRLKASNTQTNQKLQFDSAFNYLKGESKIDISESEINSNQDPYNTYTQRGLPPGPIGNPGSEALAAAMNPTRDGWLYFVATDGVHQTEFAKTYAEFERLKDKFNAKDTG